MEKRVAAAIEDDANEAEMGSVDRPADADASNKRAAWDKTRFITDVFRRPSISPAASWLITALLVLVAWLVDVYAEDAVRRSQEPHGADPEQVISEATGLWTVIIVSVLALFAGWEPILTRWLGEGWSARRKAWRARQPLIIRWPVLTVDWLAWLAYRTPSFVLSLVDYLLARPIAIAAGTTVRPASRRYGVLFLWVFGGAAAGWAAPAPYGLIAIAVALLAVFAVIRRWSWIERDREAFLAARSSDPEIERIGFGEDLRDEALTALVFVFLLIPLGLRQVDLAYDAFKFVGPDGEPLATTPGLLQWIGFFGAELFKAVPLVDWSEVFHVANGSPIEPRDALGAQLVFALRAALDLLLLAALLQAVQIAARLRDQKAAFKAGKLPILDPFAERAEFRKVAAELFTRPLVEFAQHHAIIAFPEYQRKRLCEIAEGVPDGEVARSPVLLDPEARRAAMAILAKQYPAEPATGAMPDSLQVLTRRMARETDPEMRRFALALAADLGGQSIGPDLITMLARDADAGLRAEAARLIGRLRVGSALDNLLDRLGDGREAIEVRAHAGLALAKIAPEAAPNPAWRQDYRGAELLRLAGELADQAGPEAANAAFTAGYAIALFAKRQGAVKTAAAIAEIFPKTVGALALRGARSALGELDQMARVPAGVFKMGSRDGEGFADERPQHRQAIARDFELGKYAVTFEEYESFCAATGREVPGDKNWGKGRRPVINVSWEDAHDYCDWLSAVTGERYRLPSEAEWEYACRAGTETAYSFGDSISKSQARFSEGDLGSAGKTVEVGSFLPNGFGLYDMHGNVWEWCADAWNEDYSGKPAHLKRSGDPWTTGSSSWRVLRGGSWYDVPRLRRSANRGRYYALYRDDDCGFRVARTITP